MLYLYGMRLRGFSPGAQPKEGLSCALDDIAAVTYHMPDGRPYWSVLVYTRKLTDKEVNDYDLDFIISC